MDREVRDHKRSRKVPQRVLREEGLMDRRVGKGRVEGPFNPTPGPSHCC